MQTCLRNFFQSRLERELNEGDTLMQHKAHEVCLGRSISAIRFGTFDWTVLFGPFAWTVRLGPFGVGRLVWAVQIGLFDWGYSIRPFVLAVWLDGSIWAVRCWAVKLGLSIWLRACIWIVYRCTDHTGSRPRDH